MRLEKLIEKNVAADRDLKERQRTLIETENWLPNSPDPVYYSVWGALQQMVYSHTFQTLTS